MDPIYRKHILSLGLVAALPQLAHGSEGISAAEARQIVDSMASSKFSGAAGDPKGKILELLGIDKTLLRQLQQELAGSSNCSSLLTQAARAKGAGSATRLAHSSVMKADPALQLMAKNVFLENGIPAEEAWVAAQAAQGVRQQVTIPDLFFKEKGFLGMRVLDPKIDSMEIYSLFDYQTRELAMHEALAYPEADIYLNKMSLSGSSLSFAFTIEVPGKPATQIKVGQWVLDESEAASEVVALSLVAAVQHADLLQNANKLKQEINMLRYDLLKVYRVAGEGSKSDISDALEQLDSVPDQSFFESEAAYKGRLFQLLLQSKMTIIDAAQEVQQELANAASGQIRSAAEIASEKVTPRRRGSRRAKKKVVEEVAGPAGLQVGFNQRPDPARPLTRQRSSRTGYYYPSSYAASQRDSDTLTSMAWMMDPYFMVTHPWYWGAKDGDVMSHLMLFEVMSHRHHESSGRSEPLFLGTPAYDPQQFNQPVEPKLYSTDATPFHEAWQSDKAPKDAEVMDPSEMLGWTSKQEAPTEDWSSGASSNSSASSSGWSSWVPSSTPSSSPSTTTTTTGLFDFGSSTPSTTTTTTGFDFTTTTTTTGSDWTTTTTTTGSDWTTTTGSYDTTTTGMDTTTTGSSGSDW